MKKMLLFLSLIFIIVACSDEPQEEHTPQQEITMEPDGTEVDVTDTLPNGPSYRIKISQNDEIFGEFTITTFPTVAPEHVRNFDSLVSIGFYDGTAFHRVIPGFMIQGGDPNSINKPKSTWGYGDPSQRQIPAEFNDISHTPGIVSAARSQDPNSATSQFFIMTSTRKDLDYNYTAFGKVVDGYEVVQRISQLPRDENDHPVPIVRMNINKIDTAATGQNLQ